jgi:hypothetical protein
MRSCLVTVKVLLIVLKDIKSDDGLEVETCCPIDYTVVMCLTVLSQNTHSSLVMSLCYSTTKRNIILVEKNRTIQRTKRD